MNTPNAAMAGTAHAASLNQGLWLHSKGWDLAYITGSGVLVVIPLILYEFIGTSAMFVNLFVAGVIGGPHMYATFFRTALDESFRRRHPWLIGSSLVIPVLVVACALWHFQLLITLFFFWASVHVLHQIAYILECYDRRQSQGLQTWSRFIDYAVVFSSLYPLASYRFIHDEFTIGSTLLLYPQVLKTPLVFYAVSAFFVLALAAFVAKTAIEILQGRVHYPKVLLVAVTIGLSILITSYSGDRLEIAFQGFNTWHSFQYLALTWYITTLRQRRGEIGPGPLQAIAAKGRFATFYGVNLIVTLGALVLIGMIVTLSRLPFEQSYYIVVLSFLLVHYYHDHFLFTRFGELARA